MRTIVVGTRQSQLALTQTGHVIEHLQMLCRDNKVECRFVIKKLLTKGDQILDMTLSKVGGKGLFVKEIEQALQSGEIDMAVHSLKDMPAGRQDGLIIGATPLREDPRDCLLSADGKQLDDLPYGAIIGTSSLRRAAQIKRYRPDFMIKSVRGNIDSRIRKLTTEGFDAIILAAAGLNRMGWQDRIHQYLPTTLCLPTVGQGALGIECREDDPFMRQMLGWYHHEETGLTVNAERSFLRRLEGGCQVPIGGYAVLEDDKRITLTGMVGSPDGSRFIRETMQGTDPELLGVELAEWLLSKGANDILAEYKDVDHLQADSAQSAVDTLQTDLGE